MSKVGAWTGAPGRAGEEPALWTIPVLIRNGSELPVRVNAVDLAVRPWGYERVLATPQGTGEAGYYMGKRFGNSDRTHLAPGTIAPGDTRSTGWTDKPAVVFDRPQPPMASITRVVITDAAGYQREMRTGEAGPARRVQRWRR